MAIARITNQGLTVIAVLVAVLWGCIILERSIVLRANQETYRALQDIRSLRMKRNSEPASILPPKQSPRQHSPRHLNNVPALECTARA